MLKRIALNAFVVMLAAVPAFAQTPKAEVAVTFAWVLSDGVSGDAIIIPGQGTFDRLDPKDSFGWGIDFGFFVGPNAEVGFIYGNQRSTLQAGGTTTKDIGDMSVNTYHGTFTYNLGESDATIRPYLMGGLGATSFGDVAYTRANGVRRDHRGRVEVLQHVGRRRETVWGVEGRRPIRRSLDADLHQVRRRGLLVRSVLGLLRRRRRAVCQPVRHQRRRHLPLLRPHTLSPDQPPARSPRGLRLGGSGCGHDGAPPRCVCAGVQSRYPQPRRGDGQMAVPDKAEATGPWDNPALATVPRMGTVCGSINASRCPPTRGPAAYCRARTSS